MTSITPSPEMVERASEAMWREEATGIPALERARLLEKFSELHPAAQAKYRRIATACLTAALSCPDGFRIAAFQFVQWAMQEGAWEGCSLDGGSLQDKAEALGLIVNEPYDPERHGPSGLDPEPGCDWYVLHPEIRAMLAASPAPAFVGNGGWRSDFENAPERALIAGRYRNGVAYVEESYRLSAGHWCGRKLEPPTHWQPLPSAPSQDAPQPISQDQDRG